MPMWIEYNKPWLDFEDEGLSKAGTLVEIKGNNNWNEAKTGYDDTTIAKYLIGDINEARGVCDDCVEFHKQVIVLRYKVVYKAEPKNGDVQDKTP